MFWQFIIINFKLKEWNLTYFSYWQEQCQPLTLTNIIIISNQRTRVAYSISMKTNALWISRDFTRKIHQKSLTNSTTKENLLLMKLSQLSKVHYSGTHRSNMTKLEIPLLLLEFTSIKSTNGLVLQRLLKVALQIFGEVKVSNLLPFNKVCWETVGFWPLLQHWLNSQIEWRKSLQTKTIQKKVFLKLRSTLRENKSNFKSMIASQFLRTENHWTQDNHLSELGGSSFWRKHMLNWTLITVHLMVVLPSNL